MTPNKGFRMPSPPANLLILAVRSVIGAVHQLFAVAPSSKTKIAESTIPVLHSAQDEPSCWCAEETIF
jgi:hypothetical protein